MKKHKFFIFSGCSYAGLVNKGGQSNGKNGDL